jgi:SAM-dependent methyltransferase
MELQLLAPQCKNGDAGSSCTREIGFAPIMTAAISFDFPNCARPASQRVEALLSGCAHYFKSDLPLFVSGYNELCREDLKGGKILEICCGAGELAAAMARVFPKTEVIALDCYPEAGRALKEAAAKDGLQNAHYLCGDALRLTQFADATLDLVYGQATLHHLAHEAGRLRDELARVLKPGGRLMFLYEPLGHNPLWAMIRAWRTARSEMPDESNLFISQLEYIARSFSSCHVQAFNLFGYPLKFLARLGCSPLFSLVHRTDSWLMQQSPRLARMAANFNVVFTK